MNLLNSSTIAIIGASENKNKVGYALMKKLEDFKGNAVPINPKQENILGLKAYSSVLKYKGKIDLAVIAIPAKFVANSLKECGKKGIRQVIIISSGFSEQGNFIGEEELLKIARKYKIRILGPNCFGITNPSINLDITFAKQVSGNGSVAFISQSGALWSYVSDFGLGISSFVSLGNMADLEFTDFLTNLDKDPKTKAIVLYMERLKKGKRFIRVAKKIKTPIYIIKAGSSKQGSKAAFSHTGSLATDYDIYEGAFKQAGTILCESLMQAFEKALKKKLIHGGGKKLMFKGKTTIITNAGGAGALAADYLADASVNLKGNHDILGTARSKDYARAMNSYKSSDNFVILLTPQTMTDIDVIAENIVKFKRGNKGKQIVCCFLGKKSMKNSNTILMKAGIPVFNTLEEFRRSL